MGEILLIIHIVLCFFILLKAFLCHVLCSYGCIVQRGRFFIVQRLKWKWKFMELVRMSS